MLTPRPRSIPLLSALILGAGTLVACDGDTPTSPGSFLDELSVTVETASIVFHHAPGDSVDPDLQQAFHDWFTGLIGVEPPDRIQYFKYRSQAQMQSLTGRAANGWANPPLEVHSIFRAHPHEAVHLYTYQVGRPSDFFNEGIAVAMQVDPRDPGSVPQWQGMHVHSRARSMLQAGTLRPLSEMVETDSFRSVPETDAYPLAGSFVRYLHERNGMDSLMDFFRDGDRGDSLTTIRDRSRARFGVGLEAAESSWHDFLQAWSP